MWQPSGNCLYGLTVIHFDLVSLVSYAFLSIRRGALLPLEFRALDAARQTAQRLSGAGKRQRTPAAVEAETALHRVSRAQREPAI
jgi:hypothetical protein